MDRPNTHPTSTHDHDVLGRVVSVGSDDDNDIVVKGLTVFLRHATFTLAKDGCLIRDLTKTEDRDSQTFLACADNPTERIHITKPYWASYDDIVYLGTHPFPLAQLLDIKDTSDVIDTVPQKIPSQVVSVGSDSSNRIVINAVTVSPHHAEFTLEEDGCIIRDCDSQMGTFLVDSEDPNRTIQIIGGELEASYNDVVLLGSYQFPLARLLEIKDIYLDPNKPTLKIGRASDNERPLDDIKISNYHAQFVRKGKDIFIEDLSSTNGTFLNDKQLPPRTPQIVRPGDTIKIGSYELSIEIESKDMVRVEFVGDIKLDVVDLQYAIEDKVIFDNISFSVKPGELVGIMGPAGHGKSLLIESIIHRIQPTGGKTLINEKPLSEYFEQFHSRIGYMAQSEILHSPLKVKQELCYEAELRLPSDMSDKEINEQVDEILDQLNIRNIEDRRIGVLSGGERRRVNIAKELIRAPNLLILDEPTTGLSVSDARNVMRFLRQLADAGRTVIVVIHQPGLEVYNMLDLVAILFMGRLLYYGPPQATIEHFKSGGTHPDGIFHVLDEYEEQIKAEPERAEELLNEWEYRL